MARGSIGHTQAVVVEVDIGHNQAVVEVDIGVPAVLSAGPHNCGDVAAVESRYHHMIQLEALVRAILFFFSC
jgi:hypothetical protein